MSIDVYPPRNYTQYEEGSFTVTATGFSGTAPSGTARYVRIGRQVMLELPQYSATSNATTMTLTGVPLALTAAASILFPVWLIDNGSSLLGFAQPPNSSGIIMLALNPAGTPFTASGLKGFWASTITYRIP